MHEPAHYPNLTTLTVTHAERVVLARCLTMGAAMLDALDETADARTVMDLWERVAPDDLEPESTYPHEDATRCAGCQITWEGSTRFVRAVRGCPVHSKRASS